jgi:hypothetical protein
MGVRNTNGAQGPVVHISLEESVKLTSNVVADIENNIIE